MKICLCLFNVAVTGELNIGIASTYIGKRLEVYIMLANLGWPLPDSYDTDIILIVS